MKLMRYLSSFSEEMVSIDDYIKKMKPGQDKIYFTIGNTKAAAMNNPFMEPFKGTDVPILILNNNVDEILF